VGLVRLAFVAAVGVSLLPADAEQQEKLLVRASDAAQWTLTFCDRNITTCRQSAAIWDGLKSRAQFGAKLAYELATEKSKVFAGSTGSVDRTAKVAPAAQAGTLRKHDLAPAWRGSVSLEPPPR